jgi:cell division septum initiation protein DivIVA
MSAFNKAVGDIRRIAEQFKGIIELADELDKVGSLQQAANEAKSAHTMNVAMVNKAKEEHAAAIVLVKEANEKAQKMVSDATSEADSLVKEAMDRASGIVVNGQAEGKKILTGVYNKKADIDNQVSVAQQELVNTNQSITHAKKILADLKEQLADIRKKVA